MASQNGGDSLWVREKLAFCLGRTGEEDEARRAYATLEVDAATSKDWPTAARMAIAQASLIPLPTQDLEKMETVRAHISRARSYLERVAPADQGSVPLSIELARLQLEEARVSASLSQWAQAELNYRSAAVSFQTCKKDDLAGEAWRGLGDILAQQGALRDADVAYRSAQAAYIRSKYLAGQGALHSSLASLAVDRGEFGVALGEGEAALDIQREVQKEHLSNSYLGQAEAWMEMGSYEQAMIALSQAENNYAHVKDGLPQIHSLVALLRGEILRRQDQPAQAITLWDRQVDPNQLAQPQLWYLELGYGRACEAMGKIDAALRHYEQGVGIVEKLAVSLSSPQLRAFLVARPWPLYDAIITIHHDRGDFGEALGWMERSRAQAHRQALLAASLRRDLDPEDNPKSNVLPASLDLEHFSRLDGAPALTLIYHVLDSGLLVYELAHGQVRGHKVEIHRQALMDVVKQYCLLFYRQDPREPIAATSLSKLVLTPVQKALEKLEPWDRLAIVPHNFLHFVPFHTLPYSNGRLVESLIPMYLPQVGDLALLRKRPHTSTGPNPLIVVSRAPDLSSAHAEAKVVATLRPGAIIADTAQILKGMAELKAALRDAASLYFIGHGEAADTGQSGKLHLGTSSEPLSLDATNVQNLQLNCDEVVLSTCLARTSAISVGDDLPGVLSRAFLYGGATSVVAAEGFVDERVTMQLMRNYHYFRGRTGPAEALTLAQRCMLQLPPPPPLPSRSILIQRGATITERRDLAHPGYWGGFSFTGDPGPSRPAISSDCPSATDLQSSSH